MGGNFKFQIQDSFWGRFGDLKNESNFLKKIHLKADLINLIYCFHTESDNFCKLEELRKADPSHKNMNEFRIFAIFI